MRFHLKLRRERESKGITQTRMASLLDVSQNLVSRWEAGKNTPDVFQGKAIAQVLGVPLDYLLDEARDQPLPGLTVQDQFYLDTARALGPTRFMELLIEPLRRSGLGAAFVSPSFPGSADPDDSKRHAR